jgi:hypothetical protein
VYGRQIDQRERIGPGCDEHQPQDLAECTTDSKAVMGHRLAMQIHQPVDVALPIGAGTREYRHRLLQLRRRLAVARPQYRAIGAGEQRMLDFRE